MAKVSKSAIPLTMYKHFAIVTLSLTAVIAMFADGGSRQRQAGQVETSVDEVEPEVTSSQPIIRTSPVIDTSRTPGSFGSEDNGDYGRPTVTLAAGGGGRSGTFHSPSAGSRAAVAGYDQDTIEMMTEEEYRAFLDALPRETVESMVSPEERAAQIAALERASANRSGRRGATTMLSD